MRQKCGTLGRPRGSSPRPRPGGDASCAASRPRAAPAALVSRDSACARAGGSPPAASRDRRRRRRARSRARQPLARSRGDPQLLRGRLGRRAAARSACATSGPRDRARARARPRRRACRSSSQRCTLLRCARTNRARSRRPVGTVPQPITGANPTTSCSIEHAKRAERAACPSRNRYRLTAYARVSRRSSPGVTQPRVAPRASKQRTRPPGGRARAAAAPAPADTRHDARSRREEEECSSGTASARAHTSRATGNAGERTLAAQLAEPGTRSRQRAQAHDDPTPEIGIADPSAERLQFGEALCGLLAEPEWLPSRSERPGRLPGLSRSAAAPGGPRQRPTA